MPNVERSERVVGEIIVNVKKDGTILVEGKTLSSEKLFETLSSVAKEYKDQAVILRGDKETAFEHIVEVLNVCQKAGIWNIAFATILEKRRAELKQTLPKQDPGDHPKAEIAIAKDGALSLDGKSVGLAQLEKKLAVAQKDSGGKLEVVLGAHDQGTSARFFSN